MEYHPFFDSRYFIILIISRLIIINNITHPFSIKSSHIELFTEINSTFEHISQRNVKFLFQVAPHWAHCSATRTQMEIWLTAMMSCWNPWWRRRRKRLQRGQRQGNARGPDTPIVSLVSVIPAPCTCPPFFRADRFINLS